MHKEIITLEDEEIKKRKFHFKNKQFFNMMWKQQKYLYLIRDLPVKKIVNTLLIIKIIIKLDKCV